MGRELVAIGVPVMNVTHSPTVSGVCNDFSRVGVRVRAGRRAIVNRDSARYFGAAGRAKRALSIAAFACTDSISKIDLPFNQLSVHLNGIFTPATSR